MSPLGTRQVKQVGAAVAGGALVLVGMALLVLPGPGLIVVAAGLAVLGTQFAWAKRPLQHASRKGREGLEQVGNNIWQALLSLGAGAVLCAVAIAVFAGVHIPLLGAWSAALILASGLFLIGSTVWARRHLRRPRTSRPVR